MSKAEVTRKYILEKAFELVYHNGHQATSIDKIVETTNLTKGALFYHFKNKEEMGLAIIKEVIFPRIKAGLIDPLQGSGDPIERIYTTFKNFLMNLTENQITNGCPLNNMVMEMAPVNEKFRFALNQAMEEWEDALVEVLRKAEANGSIEKGHDLRSVAKFIIASHEGARGTGKVFRSYSYFKSFLSQLSTYLDHL